MHPINSAFILRLMFGENEQSAEVKLWSIDGVKDNYVKTNQKRTETTTFTDTKYSNDGGKHTSDNE